MDQDILYMRMALREARRGNWQTAPNPMVGCVIVRDGQVVGRGWHRGAGQPHAEPQALREAGDLAQGATAYVNLEPCNHFGRTPPCAPALVKAGIKRVVAATVDPNGPVNGSGFRFLEANGIEVRSGVLAEEALRLNEFYLTNAAEGRPFVILKAALTLDGRVATGSGDSRWVTGEASRREVQRWRSRVDAVLTGAGTVRADDPELTVRLVKGKQPIRLVLSRSGDLPTSAKLFQPGGPRTVIISPRPIGPISPIGPSQTTEHWPLPDPSAASLLKKLFAEGIRSVLVEAGPGLSTWLVKHRMIDKYLLFYSPKLLGEGRNWLGDLGIDRMADARDLWLDRTRRIGEDLLIEAYPARPIPPTTWAKEA